MLITYVGGYVGVINITKGYLGTYLSQGTLKVYLKTYLRNYIKFIWKWVSLKKTLCKPYVAPFCIIASRMPHRFKRKKLYKKYDFGFTKNNYNFKRAKIICMDAQGIRWEEVRKQWFSIPQGHHRKMWQRWNIRLIVCLMIALSLTSKKQLWNCQDNFQFKDAFDADYEIFDFII